MPTHSRGSRARIDGLSAATKSARSPVCAGRARHAGTRGACTGDRTTQHGLAHGACRRLRLACDWVQGMVMVGPDPHLAVPPEAGAPPPPPTPPNPPAPARRRRRGRRPPRQRPRQRAAGTLAGSAARRRPARPAAGGALTALAVAGVHRSAVLSRGGPGAAGAGALPGSRSTAPRAARARASARAPACSAWAAGAAGAWRPGDGRRQRACGRLVQSSGSLRCLQWATRGGASPRVAFGEGVACRPARLQEPLQQLFRGLWHGGPRHCQPVLCAHGGAQARA